MNKLIFTKDFIDKINENYSKSPEKWAYFWNLINHVENKRLVNMYEYWASNVPKPFLKKILPRLREPDSQNYKSARDELRIGFHLSQLGYPFEYEKDFSGLNPDFYIKQNSYEFIVEVVTCDISEDKMGEEKLSRDLIKRINKLSFNAGISTLKRTKLENQSQSKRIVFELKRWLKSHPEIKDKIDIEGFTFRLIQYNPKWQNVQLILTHPVEWVELNKVKDKIDEKVSKYSELIENLQIPFIVAPLPDFNTSVDLEDISIILLGRNNNWSKSKIINGNIGVADLSNDGLFMKRKFLSAILWCYYDFKNVSRMILINNPSATFKLPIDLNFKTNS